MLERDKEILVDIRRLIKHRPTYGYKRVMALLNTERLKSGLGVYNKKRIYRIMKESTLLLPKSESYREKHEGTGKIMTERSDVRWCSDCFEIKCFNGEKVYVCFVLDCCDREVISFLSQSRPFLSEDIQSLMIMAVEYRFGKLHREGRLSF